MGTRSNGGYKSPENGNREPQKFERKPFVILQRRNKRRYRKIIRK
jgi:hypothetical protein